MVLSALSLQLFCGSGMVLTLHGQQAQVKTIAAGINNVSDPVLRNEATISTTNRPLSWAQPLKLEGVDNLHKINDGLYRSAQPTSKGMDNLKAMGIKTVINLRTLHSDRDEIGKIAIQREEIPVTTWDPEQGEAVQFLKIATDPSRLPVLFHCHYGSDRTGTMCAVYRIAVQGWTKEEAILEMKQGGYGFHEIWSNLPQWILHLDIEKLKKDAGIQTNGPGQLMP